MQHVDLPAVSRLIVASDGSTTLMLQALVGGDVSVKVQEERAVVSNEFSDPISKAGLKGTILVRRSQLVFGQTVLSDNLVLYAGVQGFWDPKVERPLGLQLNESGAFQRRRILTSGVDPLNGRVFKEYVIESARASPIYVRETFSSEFVPAQVIRGSQSRRAVV